MVSRYDVRKSSPVGMKQPHPVELPRKVAGMLAAVHASRSFGLQCVLKHQ